MWRRLWCDDDDFFKQEKISNLKKHREKNNTQKKNKKWMKVANSQDAPGMEYIYTMYTYITSTVCMFAIRVGINIPVRLGASY